MHYSTTAPAAAQDSQPTVTEFLAAFFPDVSEAIHLRAFKPKGAPDALNNRPRNYEVTRSRLLHDAALKAELQADNRTRGLYFIPNAGGNSDKAITRFNAFFVENDTLPIAEQHARLDAAPIPPSVRIETRKSVHAYWLRAGDCSETEWRDIQARLIGYFGGDERIKNPSRCMRLPHFNHVSHDGNGYAFKAIEVVEFAPQRRYTVAEMQAAFPPVVAGQDAGGERSQYNTSSTSPPYETEDPNADLKRLIMLVAREPNSKGKYETKCPAHNGMGNTSLFYNPQTNAFKCMNGCTTAEVRRAFGLPVRQLSSSSSSNSHVRNEGGRPQKRTSAPTLNEKTLYGLAGDIVRAIEPHSEADPAALLVQTLVGFGNFIGRTSHFVAEADRHYTNLFAVIVGASSRGRKGSSWGHVRRLLEAVDDEWAGCIVGGLSSGEGLVHHVRDNEGEANRDKRALVVETEFASVLRVQKRDSNILSAILRQAWDTGDLNVMRRNDPDKVRGAHVSIIGHITGDELKRCLQEADAVNGYANRFLWVHAQRSKKLPEGGYFHATDVAPLVSRLREAAEFARTVGEMKRDAEAAALWRKIYDGLDDEETGGQVAAILSRAEAQIMRLACVYALLDSSATVKRVHLEAAKALWDYCEASARYIFGGQALSQKAQKLLNRLNGVGAVGLGKTDIYAKFGNRIKQAELSALLSELESAGYAAKEIIGTGGHTEERWYAVNETHVRSCEIDEGDEESPADIDLSSSLSSSSRVETQVDASRLNYDLCEACEERAAIIAADGEVTNEEAERLAVTQCLECSEGYYAREWAERV